MPFLGFLRTRHACARLKYIQKKSHAHKILVNKIFKKGILLYLYSFLNLKMTIKRILIADK